MKKFVCILTTSLLCMLLFTAVQAAPLQLFDEAYLKDTLFADAQAYPFTMTNRVIGGDTAYSCFEDGSLYAWSILEDAPEKLCDVPIFAQLSAPYTDLSAQKQQAVTESFNVMAASADALYAVNPFSGGVGTLDRSGLAWLPITFDPSYTLGPSGWQRMIPCTLADDTHIYLMCDYFEEAPALYNYSVVSIDLASGETRRYKTPGLTGMCFYKENSLLTLKMDESQRFTLWELSLADGALRELSLALPEGGGWLGGLAYDAQTDSICLADGSAIYQSTAGAPFVRLKPHSYGFIGEHNQGFILPDGRYAVLFDGFTIFDVQNPPSTDNVLKVSLVSRDDGMADAFAAAYPEITLDAIYTYEHRSADQIGALIRTGDSETDVFEVYVDASFDAFKQKGYAASLEACAEIAKDAQHLYPQIASVLRDATGTLVAYPRFVRLNLWNVNTPVWEMYFADEPVPETFAQLFDAMLRFQQGEGPQNGYFFAETWSYEYFVHLVIRSYIEQYDTPDAPLTFDSSALCDALEALARVQAHMLSQGIIYQNEGDERPFSEVLDHSLFYPFGGGANIISNTTSDWGVLMPFSFGGSTPTSVHGYMSVFIVNPLSQRQELARAYIAQATRQETDLSRYYMLHEDATQPVEREDYIERMKGYEEQAAALQAQIDALAGDADQLETLGELEQALARVNWYIDHPDFLQWAIPPQGIAHWQQIAPRLHFYESSLYVGAQEDDPIAQQITSLCARYAGGQLPIDAFLTKLEDTLRLVYLEHGA